MQIVNFQAEKNKIPRPAAFRHPNGEKITLAILTPPPAFRASRGRAPQRAWRC